MVFPDCGPSADDPIKISGILGDQSASAAGGSSQQIVIREYGQRRVGGGRDHVMSLLS
jgi:hypothetical protein